ncbi:hypothetical protein BHE74_00036904 [Ensete ventricosum]|nr:hypothetical protein BHE74_00036904 [Ensete ventricosum]
MQQPREATVDGARPRGHAQQGRLAGLEITYSRKKMSATPKGHKRLRAAATTTVAVEGDMGYDYKGSSFRGHRGSSSERVGENVSLDNK